MTTDSKTGFLKQIAEAKAEVKRMKETVPHLFPEWQVLQGRKRQLEEAKARLDEAQAEWDAL